MATTCSGQLGVDSRVGRDRPCKVVPPPSTLSPSNPTKDAGAFIYCIMAKPSEPTLQRPPTLHLQKGPEKNTWVCPRHRAFVSTYSHFVRFH